MAYNNSRLITLASRHECWLTSRINPCLQFGCPLRAFVKNAFKPFSSSLGQARHPQAQPFSSFLGQARHPQATREFIATLDDIKYWRTKRKWLETTWKCHIWKCGYHHNKPARHRGNNRRRTEFHRKSCHCKFHRRIIVAFQTAIVFIQWNLESLITDRPIYQSCIGTCADLRAGPLSGSVRVTIYWKHHVWHKTLHHCG